MKSIGITFSTGVIVFVDVILFGKSIWMIPTLSKVSLDTSHFLDFSISGLRRFRFTYLSVLQFLKDKTILVTGATGFLAKIFVEKILRIQPNLKKLYLLIRAGDDKSAKQRMFQKDLFRVLRDTWGDSLDCFILEKVVAVPGDILYEDLGIKDSNLKEEMYRQIDLVVNVAAITKFDERYDALLDTNTMGAFHVLSFAKNCTKIQMFVHLSSAYACGEKSGLIPENSFTMGEMLKWPRKLDIIAEKELVEQKLNQLQTTGAAEDEVTSIMKDLGTERAQ
ncbi:hypothetical protein CUMW_152270 [Citrus unshiu]|uniref:Fatty acyl-CoA reductase n=1 Tax=Citrus unshiu TaxID=55188 RepID=A0A2H5PND8_CITUN|nr:hypothetical protein CUMW_152270 [Citrus unshiu]GAY53868.1 hypothetical protein CUMW_152270 [Citrus unshiu]